MYKFRVTVDDIKVAPSGVSKSLYVKMNDPDDQTRFHGISGGVEHDFATRIQNTRMYELVTFPTTHHSHIVYLQKQY